MREEHRPSHLLRALEVAEELLPEPAAELAGLPPSAIVQSRLFDALVLLAAAREEAQMVSDGVLARALPEIGRICDRLDEVLAQLSC